MENSPRWSGYNTPGRKSPCESIFPSCVTENENTLQASDHFSTTLFAFGGTSTAFRYFACSTLYLMIPIGFICAFLTAVGGGTVCSLLVGQTQLGNMDSFSWWHHKTYIYCSLAGAVLAFLLHVDMSEKATRVFDVSDRLALAVFAPMGVSRAFWYFGEDAPLSAGLVLLSFAFGGITAAGGGFIRDCLLLRTPFAISTPYGLVPALGGVVHLLLHHCTSGSRHIWLASSTIIFALSLSWKKWLRFRVPNPCHTRSIELEEGRSKSVSTQHLLLSEPEDDAVSIRSTESGGWNMFPEEAAASNQSVLLQGAHANRQATMDKSTASALSFENFIKSRPPIVSAFVIFSFLILFFWWGEAHTNNDPNRCSVIPEFVLLPAMVTISFVITLDCLRVVTIGIGRRLGASLLGYLCAIFGFMCMNLGAKLLRPETEAFEGWFLLAYMLVPFVFSCTAALSAGDIHRRIFPDPHTLPSLFRSLLRLGSAIVCVWAAERCISLIDGLNGTGGPSGGHLSFSLFVLAGLSSAVAVGPVVLPEALLISTVNFSEPQSSILWWTCLNFIGGGLHACSYELVSRYNDHGGKYVFIASSLLLWYVMHACPGLDRCELLPKPFFSSPQIPTSRLHMADSTVDLSPRSTREDSFYDDPSSAALMHVVRGSIRDTRSSAVF